MNKKFDVSADFSWKDGSIGGIITESGNSKHFKTGDWRSEKPIWYQENCIQCLFCYCACPDTSILVDKETGKVTGVDYDHCKGCGVCAAVCPVNKNAAKPNAIDMVSEAEEVK